MIRSCRVLLVLLSIIYGRTEAQWTLTNGPFGGDVKAIVSSGDTVYAGMSTGGIFRSTDAGQTWTGLNKGFQFTPISSMVMIGSTILAGTSFTGIIASTDHGTTWETRMSGLTVPYITSFAVAGKYLFAGTQNGVFRSTDVGQTWTAVNTGLTNTNVKNIAASGVNVLVHNSGSGVFVSNDTGATWKFSNKGIEFPFVTGVGFIDSTMYLSTSSYGLYKSTDRGANWTALPFNFSVMDVSSLTVLGSTMYAAHYGELFRSLDKGVTWSAAGVLMSGSSYKIITCISKASTALLCGTEIFGMHRSTDNGVTWNASNSGLRGVSVYVLEQNGTTLFAGTSGGLFSSNNNGDAWEYVERKLNIPPPSISHISVYPPLMFAGHYAFYERSTDNGSTWNENAGNGFPANSVTDMAVIGTDIFVGTDNAGVYRSTDNGSTWNAGNTGLTNTAIRSLRVKGNDLFAGTNNGVFRTTNSGGQWTVLNNGLTGQVNSISSADSVMIAGGESGLARTTNDGASWSMVTVGGNTASVAHVTREGMNVAACKSDGVYLSANNGLSWKKVLSDTVLNGSPYKAKITGTHLFVPRYGSVWKRSLAELQTAVVGNAPSVPGNYLLEQNYPNPFNPSTTVAFSIPSSSSVRVSVSDLLGREIALLHEGMTAAGRHEVRWDASSAASGVYLIRMQSGTFTSVRKVALLR